jgi:4-hydroxythreonine-4-phosphate dehydrogenase
MSGDPRPILAVTMGDPAGIGPEIAARALLVPTVRATSRPLVVGDAAAVERAARLVGLAAPVRAIASVADARFESHTIEVIDQRSVDAASCPLGRVSAAAGQAAFVAVIGAIELANRGEVDAVVTTPIHKEALAAAGHRFPGHTEIFAHHTGVPESDVTMMLAVDAFRVVHVSTHVSLRQACDAVTRPRVRKVIELADRACRDLGIGSPRIGVAGLNPHAGDGGLFGTEETDHIAPAIADARAAGIDVEGPQPADTFFAKAFGGAYDCVVAMYHDQGHVPAKIRGFRYDGDTRRWTDVRGINVSLGLPILRVSVDHGTAFDQAGKGTASEESLLDAIDYATKMSAARKRR